MKHFEFCDCVLGDCDYVNAETYEEAERVFALYHHDFIFLGEMTDKQVKKWEKARYGTKTSRFFRKVAYALFLS